MSQPGLELVLFEHDAAKASRMVEAGIETLMMDWEWRGKAQRQAGADTEIEVGTPEALEELCRSGAKRVFCRINRFGDWTKGEIEAAIARGATGLFLPMVESAGEVEEFLRLVRSRVQAHILIETERSAQIARDLGRLPLDGIYVGLNDLAISRGARFIFESVLDGTVERIRDGVPETTPFGFGGVTCVDRGAPIPCHLLLQELERLRARFCFARRSFRAHVMDRSAQIEIGRIQSYWVELSRRTPEERMRDREALHRSIRQARGSFDDHRPRCAPTRRSDS